MNATHEVQVWNHKGSLTTRWYACEVIGRHPAPESFANAGATGDWYDVRLADGSVYQVLQPRVLAREEQGWRRK